MFISAEATGGNTIANGDTGFALGAIAVLGALTELCRTYRAAS